MTYKEMKDYILRSGNGLRIFKELILVYGPEDAVDMVLDEMPEADRERLMERAYNKLR